MSTLVIPTSIIDNFFNDPDSIREFALSQDFFKSEDNRWPGVRTKSLREIAPEFQHKFLNKISSALYGSNTRVDLIADAFFQVVDERYERGWVHNDGVGSVLTSIVYLTPGSFSGTSMYLPKTPLTYNHNQYISEKRESFRTEKIDSSSRDKHNSNYIETISIRGLYNRALIFDSHLFHAAQEFFGDTNISSRLTLVVFINAIITDDQSPIIRLKKSGEGI